MTVPIILGIRLTVWLGILAVLFLSLTILSGLKILKISFKGHRFLGITTGILALVHGVMIYLAYFMVR